MAILTKQDENTVGQFRSKTCKKIILIYFRKQPSNVENVSKNLSNPIKPKILIKTRDNKQDTITVAKQVSTGLPV